MVGTSGPGNAWRTWAALVSFPFLLALSFGSYAAWLALVRGVPSTDLQAAIEADPLVPGVSGFLLAAACTRWLARADGMSWRAMGLVRPVSADAVVAVLAGTLVVAGNTWWFHPWVVAVQPSFDPAQAKVPLVTVLVVLPVAALAEDLLFRGFAFVRLRERDGVVAAIVVTSVAYVAVTPGEGWGLRAWSLGFGILLGVLRAWRDNVWVPWVVHVVVALTPRIGHELGR